MMIFLAGTECFTKENRYLMPQSKYILTSFYSVSKWQIPYIHKVDKFFLDSGAYTLFSTGHSMTMSDWENYTDRLGDFINENDIKYFFEVDVDRIIGLEAVEYLRRRLETRTGKKCIPVWHKNRGWDYFEKMCYEYPFVAIGGVAGNPDGKKIEKFFPKFIDCAHSYGTRIHGLGYTNTAKLPLYHFDSVDSTSWSSGYRFGTINKFNGKRIINIQTPDGMRIKSKDGYLTKVQKLGFDEWCKYQRWADTHI